VKTEVKSQMSNIKVSNGSGAVLEDASRSLDIPINGNLEQRIADLESRPRMPSSGDETIGDVLTLDANLRPRWEAGSSLVDGDHEGQLLVWHIDEITEEGSWIPYLPTSNIMLWFDATGTGEWKELTIPTEGAKVVRTDETSTVKFDYPIYSDGA